MKLNTSLLLGLAEFAPTNDVRYYLNGIMADFTRPEYPALVATDGNGLIAALVNGDDDDLSQVPCLLLTKADLAGLPAGKEAVLTFDEHRVTITVLGVKGFTRTITSTVISVPNWRKVINQPATKPAPAALACSLAGRFAAFAKKNKTGAVVVTAGPMDPSAVWFDKRPDLFGAVMPRTDALNVEAPAWTRAE